LRTINSLYREGSPEAAVAGARRKGAKKMTNIAGMKMARPIPSGARRIATTRHHFRPIVFRHRHVSEMTALLAALRRR
jgi:hypothetical protein